MRPYVLGAAVLLVSAAGAFLFWRERGAMLAASRDIATCKVARGGVYAFVGESDRFLTAVIDVAHPAKACVDRHIPRDGRDVGVRGSDGAIIYLADGHLLEARPEKGSWSDLHHAFSYPRTSRSDPDIEARACPGRVDGFLTDPDGERLVYWCQGGGAIHDTSGKDLDLDAKTERPLALGHHGRLLTIRDGERPSLVVHGPLGAKFDVAGVEVRFNRARIPVRAIDSGFLVLLPRGLSHAHDMYRVDEGGHAIHDQRYEDLPEAEVGTLDVVIDADASLFLRTELGNTGEEVVVRLPPGNKPAEVVLRQTADHRFASSSLFVAP